MKFNKITCLISALLLILLVACQDTTKPVEKAETNQENITENASETPSSVEPSPVEPSPETSPSLVTPPKDTFEESQSISIKCGTEQEFQGLQILAECPTDTDKDDRPDKESSNVTFSNPFEQVIYLTFPTANNNDGYNDDLTALIQPKSSIVLPVDNNKFDYQTQSFQEIKVGLGKIKVSALPENTFSENLSCEKEVQGSEKRQYGVLYKLECSPNTVVFAFTNSAETPRVINLTYTDKNGVEWINVPSVNKYGSRRLSLPKSESYKLDIFIPELSEAPNSQ